MAEHMPESRDDSAPTVFLCCGDGEGSHEFRVCATEQEVFDYYEYLCGQDHDGTVNSIKSAFADPDEWRNSGTMLELKLYCATFSVWKVEAKELRIELSSRSETPRINPVGLVKMISEQRDEIWNAALEYLAASDQISGGGKFAPVEFEVEVARFGRAEEALRAACAKVPSYSERLDNIMKGLADVE
jgi:hypothetical protein